MAHTETRRGDRKKRESEEETEIPLSGPSGQDVAEPARDPPERSEGEPAVERTLEEDPPTAKDREDALSENAEGAIAPPRSDYRNRPREELLDRASELGLNMDPSVDREVLMDKLSEAESTGGTQEEAGSSRQSRRERS